MGHLAFILSSLLLVTAWLIGFATTVVGLVLEASVKGKEEPADLPLWRKMYKGWGVCALAVGVVSMLLLPAINPASVPIYINGRSIISKPIDGALGLFFVLLLMVLVALSAWSGLLRESWKPESIYTPNKTRNDRLWAGFVWFHSVPDAFETLKVSLKARDERLRFLSFVLAFLELAALTSLGIWILNCAHLLAVE